MSRYRTSTQLSHAMDRSPLLRSASISGLSTASRSTLGTPSRSSRKLARANTFGSVQGQYNVLCRSSSLSCPSYISGNTDKASSGNRNPWLELQREMGSLKADNQLGSSCHSSRSSGGGDALRGLTHPQGSELVTKPSSVADSADQRTQAEIAALARTLSLRLDLPVSPWENNAGGRSRRQIQGENVFLRYISNSCCA